MKRSRKRKLCTFILFLLFITTIYMMYKFTIMEISVIGSAHHRQRISANSDLTILIWTKFWNSDWIAEDQLIKTKYGNCRTTNNRTRFEEADGLLFHWMDVRVTDLPAVKYSHQRWFLANHESPEWPSDQRRMSKYSFYYMHLYRLTKSVDFDITFRRNSDVFTPYGVFRRREMPLNRSLVDVHKRQKSIAWLVSHCITRSKREQFARELSEHIDVDVMGACGRRISDERRTNTPSSDYEYIEAKYKFYLSFENAICTDYYTEKVVNIMRYDVVPVVLGGADYETVLPPKSFINALDFTGPKELAAYLKELGENNTEYNSYLEWKRDYEVTTMNMEELVCEKVYSSRGAAAAGASRRRKRNWFEWWFTEGNCKDGWRAALRASNDLSTDHT